MRAPLTRLVAPCPIEKAFSSHLQGRVVSNHVESRASVANELESSTGWASGSASQGRRPRPIGPVAQGH